jgi:hypothetical protein
MGGSAPSDPGKSAEFMKPLQQIAASLSAYGDQLTAAMDFGLAKWLLQDVFDDALGDVQGRRDILVGLATLVS